MKTHFLFPNKLKKIGWFLFLLPIVTFIILKILDIELFEAINVKTFAIYNDDDLFNNGGYFKIIKAPVLDEILLISCLTGGLFVGFSKLKNEDEMTAKIRYESLAWATYFNVISIITCTVFVYGFIFLNFMMFFMISSVFFFVLRFHFMIYKLHKASNDEE
jgi:hypothetical protein